ncbi:MAG: hypothetical protein VSS75_033300 [Candidatus Parabeggiatoa sp.]|nr:hypothetical protein [Candidatus Parabeggiatoa sp.]
MLSITKIHKNKPMLKTLNLDGELLYEAEAFAQQQGIAFPD